MANKIAGGIGKPYYFTEADEKVIYPAINDKIDCEILIVGGGLTGLFTAYYLNKEGKDVCLVEKGVIGGGQTKYLPPIIRYDADKNLVNLREEFGHDNALWLYRRFRQSLEEIEEIVKEVSSECGFKKRDCFYFTDKTGSHSKIEEEYRLRKYGGFDVECIKKHEALDMFSFPVEKGIYSQELAAEINPVKFAKDFAAYLSVHGVQIYEESEVKTVIEKDEGGYMGETVDGFTINAQAICDCRGHELINRYKSLGKLKTAFTTWSRTVQSFPGWTNRCSLKDDYCSPLFLSVTANDRIMISGFDSKILKPDASLLGLNLNFWIKSKYETLQQQAVDMFFGLDDLSFSHSCCGVYIDTRDGLPVAGEDRHRKGFYYACCGNKNNIIYSTIVAQIIRGEYIKQPLEKALLFDLKR